MELLVVIAVITVLAGFLMPALRSAKQQAKIEETKAMIGALEVAINMYFTDQGSYPPDTSGTNTFNTYLANQVDGYGPYIEFDSDEVSGNAAIDPWGRDYRYEAEDNNAPDPTNNQYTFDLWSLGPDQSDAADDIDNW